MLCFLCYNIFCVAERLQTLRRGSRLIFCLCVSLVVIYIHWAQIVVLPIDCFDIEGMTRTFNVLISCFIENWYQFHKNKEKSDCLKEIQQYFVFFVVVVVRYKILFGIVHTQEITKSSHVIV